MTGRRVHPEGSFTFSSEPFSCPWRHFDVLDLLVAKIPADSE